MLEMFKILQSGKDLKLLSHIIWSYCSRVVCYCMTKCTTGPNSKNLQTTILNVTKMAKFLCYRVENIDTKGENAGLLFRQYFQRLSFSSSLQSRLYGTGLIIENYNRRGSLFLKIFSVISHEHENST